VNLRNYIFVTGAYWGFTIADGALRMLVLQLGSKHTDCLAKNFACPLRPSPQPSAVER
jgi:hypothetical protein